MVVLGHFGRRLCDGKYKKYNTKTHFLWEKNMNWMEEIISNLYKIKWEEEESKEKMIKEV